MAMPQTTAETSVAESTPNLLAPSSSSDDSSPNDSEELDLSTFGYGESFY